MDVKRSEKRSNWRVRRWFVTKVSCSRVETHAGAVVQGLRSVSVVNTTGDAQQQGDYSVAIGNHAGEVDQIS